MGFFSWQTADTRQSIWNVYSGQKVQPVFLLQPNGEASIREDAYEGYGVFGGTDAFAWLARHNFPAYLLAGKDEETIIDLGVTLDCGSYYVDSQDGAKHCVFHKGPTLIDPEINFHSCRYDDILPSNGTTPNDLVASGRWIEKRFDITNPLKFSFFPGAVYEHLPASETCPSQGFFEPVDEAA